MNQELDKKVNQELLLIKAIKVMMGKKVKRVKVIRVNKE